MRHPAQRPRREIPVPGSAPARYPARPRRRFSATARKAAAYLPLVIFFWFIFYQNLPEDLNGMAFKPFSTAGALDRFIKIGTIVLALSVIIGRWSVSRQMLKDINPGLVAVMVLIPLGTMWSFDSNATILRYITLLGIVLLCIAIPLAGWDRRRLQEVVLPPVMAILVVSLVIGILYPENVKEIGTDLSLNNAWHGITFQKNQFGTTSSIVTILCVHRVLAPGKHTFWTYVGIATALLCLFLSRSSTSLLSMMLVVMFMVMVLKVPFIKQFTTLVTVGIFSLILVYELAVQNLIPGVATLLAPVMHLTGKDMTFSARSVIWDIVKQHSAGAPWLGTGYGAYWLGDYAGSPSYLFVALMYFYPTESHNGYLEILNDLGRVGLLCLLAFLVFHVRQALQLMKYDRGQAVLYLGLLFQQMVDNLSESEWFSRTATCTILLLASACLSRALAEKRLAAPAAPARSR